MTPFADLEDDAAPPCPCHDWPLPPDAARGWSELVGPLPVLRARHRIGNVPGWRPAWADHSYRLRLPDGRWLSVAEPYSLDAEAIADLAHLVREGFEVRIAAWRARHYRGHTVAVEIVEGEP
jgi:hypothetical protein